MDYQLKNFKIEFHIKRLSNIHYFEFQPNYITKKEYHDCTELIYMDNGEAEVISDTYQGILKQGEMLIHYAGQTHQLKCLNEIAPNVVIILFECNDFSFDEFSAKPFPLDENLKKILADIIKEGRNIFLPPYDIPNLKNMPKRRNFEFGADQLIKNLLENFLIYCIRKREFAKKETKTTIGTSENAYIMPIKEYIDNNFSKNITLSDLCFLFGTNKTTLCKEFKSLTGSTVVDYINKLRVKHTKILLREKLYTLTQIADILNLSSVHYLTTLFKKYEKLTPTEYLASIKSKYE